VDSRPVDGLNFPALGAGARHHGGLAKGVDFQALPNRCCKIEFLQLLSRVKTIIASERSLFDNSRSSPTTFGWESFGNQLHAHDADPIVNMPPAAFGTREFVTSQKRK